MNATAAQRALEYAGALARRNLNPLSVLLGPRATPESLQQYPDPGITWIAGGLGYFYHSHGPDAQPRAEHGHFHLFAQPSAPRGRARRAPYAHLLGIAVDATGAPRRIFATNLWVTAGRWLATAAIGAQLDRFARAALRPESGPERWIGLILRLYPDAVREVLSQRERRVARWRREQALQRRLADRRIHTLSSVCVRLAPPRRA